jgi:hypothetical protein
MLVTTNRGSQRRSRLPRWFLAVFLCLAVLGMGYIGVAALHSVKGEIRFLVSGEWGRYTESSLLGYPTAHVLEFGIIEVRFPIRK